MSISEAEPGDIYVDANSKLWRVISICRDPTVTVEEVEPSSHSTDTTMFPGLAGVAVGCIGQTRGNYIRVRQTGIVCSIMWSGFTRIFRKPSTTYA